MNDVVIIGAGVTGLALARRLSNEGKSVVVLESDARVGGPIRSLKTGGLVIECGPQALRVVEHTITTLEELSMQDRIVEGSAAVSKRFILWDGKLRPVPRALFDRAFFKKRELLRMMAEPMIARRDPPRMDESAYDFVSRRFGKAVAERLLDPFVAGIYAGDVHQLEMSSAFPDVVKWEGTGSVVAGMIGSRRGAWRPPSWAPKRGYTLKNGVQSLVDMLEGALPAGVLKLSTPVERVERRGAGFLVRAKGGNFDASRVVVTVGGPRAAAIFAAGPNVPDVARDLASQPSSFVASVHLAFKASEAPSPEGFGWLSPTSQRKDVLGVVWVSSVFPAHYPGRTVLRVMLGGAREDVSKMTDEALLLRARKVVAEVEGIRADPAYTHIQRATLPQYNVGHAARQARLRESGVDFVGWPYTGNGVDAALGAARAWK